MSTRKTKSDNAAYSLFQGNAVWDLNTALIGARKRTTDTYKNISTIRNDGPAGWPSG